MHIKFLNFATPPKIQCPKVYYSFIRFKYIKFKKKSSSSKSSTSKSSPSIMQHLNNSVRTDIGIYKSLFGCCWYACSTKQNLMCFICNLYPIWHVVYFAHSERFAKQALPITRAKVTAQLRHTILKRTRVTIIRTYSHTRYSHTCIVLCLRARMYVHMYTTSIMCNLCLAYL